MSKMIRVLSVTGGPYSKNLDTPYRYVAGGSYAQTPMGAVAANFAKGPKGREIDGVYLGSFSSDYYFRIHINISEIDLGNLLKEEVRSVYVWNSYMEPKEFVQLNEMNASGIEVHTPNPDPIFVALEEREYVITIRMDGDPEIDAGFVWEFEDTNSPTLVIIGTRVVLWPLCPRRGYTERLSWLTDVIKTVGGEQRIALRTNPRLSIQYRHTLSDPKTHTRVWHMLHDRVGLKFCVPLWGEIAGETSVQAGADEIFVNPDFCRLRPGGFACLWESEGRNEVVSIEEVTPNSLRLAQPVEGSYKKALVIPAAIMLAETGVESVRSTRNITDLSVSFEGGEEWFSEQDSGPDYLGYPIFIYDPFIVPGLDKRIKRDMDIFDSGAGVVETDWKRSYTDVAGVVSVIATSREQLWEFRKWLMARKGRQKAFWMPSYIKEIKVVREAHAGPLGLIVEYNDLWRYRDGFYIFIELKDGHVAGAHVREVDVTDDGDEELIFSAAADLPNVQPSDFERVSMMQLVRLDADQVDLEFGEAMECRIKIPTAGIPYVLP